MADLPFLAVLSVGTMVVALGVALYLFARVRDSQAKRGETPGGIAGPSS